MILELHLELDQIGHGILVGKGLVRAEDVIPVMLLNINGSPVHRKK